MALEQPLTTTEQSAPSTTGERVNASRPWWFIPTFVTVLAVIGLLAYALAIRDRSQLMSGPAPNFTLQTFDGEAIELSALQGKPVIINFWASWCIECDKEMAFLERASVAHQGEVVFLGIDYLDTEPKAREYLAQYGISYPNGPDLGGRISNDYNIKGVPETFFIGKDGTIRGIKVGPLEEAELAGWITQLRAE